MCHTKGSLRVSVYYETVGRAAPVRRSSEVDGMRERVRPEACEASTRRILTTGVEELRHSLGIVQGKKYRKEDGIIM